jgi:hypothetical protein
MEALDHQEDIPKSCQNCWVLVLGGGLDLEADFLF